MRTIATARAVLLLAALGAGGGATLATPALAANLAKKGVYTDNRPGKTTSIVVARGATSISGMSVSCPHSRYATGVVQLRDVPISADGTFAVEGLLTVRYVGSGTRRTGLRIAGTFQRGKVVGSLAPRGRASICQRMSFSARYFGNVRG